MLLPIVRFANFNSKTGSVIDQFYALAGRSVQHKPEPQAARQIRSALNNATEPPWPFRPGL